MRLYHSSPVALEGRFLNPSTRNIRLAVNEAGEGILVFTEYSDQNAPCVYATDNLQLSATYTVPKGIRLANMHGFGGTEILILDQAGKIGDPDLKGGVYRFESEDFRQIHVGGEGIDQWVSFNPVDLETANFTPVNSLNDIMKTGVQIYQISDVADYDAGKFYNDLCSIQDDPDGSKVLVFLSQCARSGKLQWMNAERNINPLPCLENPVSGTGAGVSPPNPGKNPSP